ncbi:uncharacterized protein [Rutidosis leptorrhynchoides]|uniref:uncharacterized protein n=1 Tax=Rutidosis leptorrhynchoides TaxID=125765 RepID=UPI003A98E178
MNVDCFQWITNSGKYVNFSSHQVWIDLKADNVKVNWAHVIWFNYLDPKQAFIIWLAKLNRLTTHDRLENWISGQNFKCALCGLVKDSVCHLFFSCEYSSKVWRKIKERIIFKGIPNSLPEIMNELAKFPVSNHIWSIINRWVVAACVYFIWQERNFRMFRNEERKEDVICSVIVNFVQCKLMSIKVKKSSAVMKAASLWNMRWIDNKLVLN